MKPLFPVLAIFIFVTACSYQDASDTSFLNEKIRCSELGNKNEEELLSEYIHDATVTYFYSPKRDSCIAELLTVEANFTRYLLKDIITGNNLIDYDIPCAETNIFCVSEEEYLDYKDNLGLPREL